MPCDAGPSYSDIEEARKERDIITRLACAYCKLLESQGRPVPDWAQSWWEAHKRYDAEREAQEMKIAERERTRQAALRKLSPTERKALGLERMMPNE